MTGCRSTTQTELAALRAAGRVVAETIRELSRRVRPGVTTRDLDEVAARVFAAHGARSGPQLDYDFPRDRLPLGRRRGACTASPARGGCAKVSW